jgi:flagellar biosynthesis protein FlhF
MEVKKYRAGSIQEAINLVKADLGSDALILSTRKLSRQKGPSGFKGQALFEIDAMVGGRRCDSFGLNPSDLSNLDSLKSELRRIKTMMLPLNQSSHLMTRFKSHSEAIDLYAKLIRHGIAGPHAETFLSRGGAFSQDGQSVSHGLHEGVLKEVLNVIDVTDPFAQGDGQIVAAFVGPTGVGKTTTIAKLAADLSLKHKKHVGLISIDNYRIGAVEQLKIYAGILGVPCFRAFSGADLRSALGRLSQKDIILIDTAGQSHYDTARMEEIEALIGGDQSIKSHLLLSAATSEVEMDAAATKFGRLNFSSYIFTKTDETKTRGIIINQLLRLRLPVSFVTTGQRVPEDIFKATKTGILRLVLE